MKAKLVIEIPIPLHALERLSAGIVVDHIRAIANREGWKHSLTKIEDEHEKFMGMEVLDETLHKVGPKK